MLAPLVLTKTAHLVRCIKHPLGDLRDRPKGLDVAYVLEAGRVFDEAVFSPPLISRSTQARPLLWMYGDEIFRETARPCL